MPDAVLFDLDGTLIDTAPDMGGALNNLLREEKRDPLPLEQLRPYVSQGGLVLTRIGFGEHVEESEIEPLRQRFLTHYRAIVADNSRLFDGFEAVLQRLEARGIPWGIVTNKPGFLTDPLLEQLDITPRVGCVVSGDTLPTRKPDPAPMLYAAKQIGVASSECIYIGDDLRDVQAGQGAAMKTIAAAYGYIIPGDDPASWGADGIIYTPTEINDWLT